MDWGNISLAKKDTNSHLLKLLTRRATTSVPNINKNNEWPGKYKPSLTNIKIPRTGKSDYILLQDEI